MTRRSKPPSTAGRPKDPAKYAAILNAAKQLFIEKGYGASSMAAIAAAAGVSKLTLYSHFADKDALFTTAVKCKCEEQLPPVFFQFSEDTPIRQALLTIGLGFYNLVNSEEALALHRLIIAQASQNPRVSQLFYDAGPRRVLDAMEQLLQAAHGSRQLDVPQPRAAAEHFLSMIKGGHNLRLLAGIGEPPDVQIARQHVEDVVDLFMRAFSAR
ncbi:MAG: TetR/AcrR family transcriptional regulator [Gammaproteobacteria bacterium]